MRIKRDSTFRILYALVSQGMLGIMSILTSIILPKQMGPEQYGYFQEFAFYLMYLNMLSLGFNDGITLNYAGKSKEELPIKNIRSAILIHTIYSVILTAIMSIVTIVSFDQPRLFIFTMVGLNIVPTILSCVFSGIFLAENNSYIYNTLNMIQRAMFCIFIVGLIVAQRDMYWQVIIANTAANWIILIVSAVKCKDYITGDRSNLKQGFNEYKNLCFSGIMIALSVTFMGLISTFGRVVIEYNDSIYNYGVFSFYIGLLSIVLTFANAIGVVAFPMMRNTDEKTLIGSYDILDRVYRVIGGAMFYIYPILIFLIARYMPKYSSGINYFMFLLAICYPFGKIQMIIVPFFKTYRLERKLFIINAVCIIVTIAADYIAYALYNAPLAVAISTALCCMIYYTALIKGVPSHLKKHSRSMILDWTTPLAFTIIAIKCTGVEFILLYSIYYVIALIFAKAERNSKTYAREGISINEKNNSTDTD